MALDPALAATRGAVRADLAGHLPDGAGIGPGDTIVVACSGGADSLALLAATVFVGRVAREALGCRVVGAVVDHDLQDGSEQRTRDVVAQMAALGVDETVSARVRVDPGGQGVEAAAREARYAVLTQVAESFGAQALLLGHTLDDQAETVLLGLARGSGGRSIAGMRRAYEIGNSAHGPIRVRRPLLDLTRAETEAACRAQRIDFWVDPHNSDPRFTRSRLRERVLPVLAEEVNPRVRHNLSRTADLLRADLEALDDLADEAYARAVRTGAGEEEDGDGGGAPRAVVDLAALAGSPRAIRTRVLRRAALAAGARGAELFAVHVDALERLCEGPRGARTDLPGHLTAYRAPSTLVFRGGGGGNFGG